MIGVESMGIAPSEKHLEDYIYAHPETLGMIGIPPAYGPDAPFYEFVGRQVRIPSGIIDLVGLYCDHHVAIVELKRGVITTDAFAQIMRYMRDVRQLARLAVHEALSGHYETFGGDWRINDYFENKILHSALIGRNIPNDLRAACDACGVDIILYDYCGGSYSFESVNRKGNDPLGHLSKIFDLQRSPIGHLVQNAARLWVGIELDDINRPFDVIQAANNHLTTFGGGA